MVGDHVVLRASVERLVRSNDHTCRLGDVLFGGESPDVGDLVRAGAAQGLTPAAVVEEQHPATVVEDSFMSCRHGNATRVDILPDIGEGHETNDASHRGIFATRHGALGGTAYG